MSDVLKVLDQADRTADLQKRADELEAAIRLFQERLKKSPYAIGYCKVFCADAMAEFDRLCPPINKENQ